MVRETLGFRTEDKHGEERGRDLHKDIFYFHWFSDTYSALKTALGG